jgi:hypothetical protein
MVVKMVAHMREEHRLRVLRIIGPKRDDVTREWRKLYNEELNDLYSTSSIVWVIKLRRMSWEGHVACMGERRGYTGLWLGNLRERDYL